MVVSGECFIHALYPAEGLRLQIIPSDQIDAGLNRQLDGGGYVIDGVEFNAAGVRTAYHVLPRRPDGFLTSYTPIRVPATDMLQTFRPLHPGQVRGLPWLAPALATLSELDGLLEALLTGARVSAMHAGFLQDLNGTGAGLPYDGAQV